MRRESELVNELIGTRICDAHVHAYPGEVAADPAGFARIHGEPHWLKLVTNGPQGWADADQLILAMDRDGIEKAVLLGWYWQNPQTCRIQNAWYAESIRKYPDRLVAFAAIHPNDPDIVRQLESAREWGAVGVGEGLPGIQSVEGWQSPGWKTILNWTSDNGWPVNLHVTEPVGHVYPGRVETPLMQLVELFEAYPQQKWICSHWGGGLPFYALNRRVARALRNVWFDSAASPLLFSADVWKVVLQLMGKEKIIFGSDFPLLLDPQKNDVPNWKRILSQVDDCQLDSGSLSALLWDNIHHLAIRRA